MMLMNLIDSVIAVGIGFGLVFFFQFDFVDIVWY